MPRTSSYIRSATFTARFAVAVLFVLGLAASASAADVPAPADVAAPPADATTTASGLAWKILTPSTMTQHPSVADTVEVHYTGWTTDGKMFDSSVLRGETIKFPLNKVIKGWTEGVQLMVVGEKRRFWIPGELAYGNEPKGDRPYGMLVFDVELYNIEKAVVTPTVPADVAGPPADAQVTASGLAYKILKPGTGTVRPGPTSSVKVHYSGWTSDGKMFDSSVQRGEALVFPVNAVIPGWVEGLQLMVVGEQRRLWIPAELAYGVSPQGGRPAGMLVFDVELIEIQ